VEREKELKKKHDTSSRNEVHMQGNEPDRQEDMTQPLEEEQLSGRIDDYTETREDALPPPTSLIMQKTLSNIQAVPVVKKRASRTPAFPEVTSSHATPLPATESFLVLSGTFGVNVSIQASLLDGGFDVTTPIGRMRVEGQTSGENTSLQNYVTSELGPEGFKETAALLDIYDTLTGGQSQTQNVEVTAKQVLQRMGKGNHANDNDLQAHLVNTLLYLARTLVVNLSPKRARISPLLVLESVVTDEFENVHLKFHLGEETYESLYGPEPQLYPLSTTRLVGLHGEHSRYEILLTQYLGNRLANQETLSLYFITLCLYSGVLTLERLLPAQKNRMRDAQQVISALMQLEQNGYIRCASHPDLDVVVVANVLLGMMKREQLATTALERMEEVFRVHQTYKKEDLRRKRTRSLQRLLNIEYSREDRVKENPEFITRLTFYPGEQFLTNRQALLDKQKELFPDQTSEH
jgi:hypothetical protein